MSARTFARQARLAEVGVEGQARIEAARVTIVGAEPARAIAEAYVSRAGVGGHGRGLGSGEEPGGAPVSVVCASLGLSEGPAAVGSGALAALVALRAVLGLGTPEDRLRTTETDATRHV